MLPNPVPEGRTRSRSKTPFHLRSACDGENCNEVGHVHAPTKKNPTVETITEEIEQSPAPLQKSTVNTRKAHVDLTESSNSVSSTNDIQTAMQASLSSTKASSIGLITAESATTTRNNRAFEMKSSNSSSKRTVLKSKRILNTTTEVKENIINSTRENIHVESPRASSSFVQNVSRSHNTSLENLNMNDHLPFKEYKEAGEYWKKFPKTDYVYSSVSPHRREIRPGIIAMPNMSRKSLDNHHDRVNIMASNNPSEESYIRRRYQSTYDQYQNANDSQDEYDVSDYYYTSNYQKTVTNQSLVKRFTSSIFTFIVTLWSSFCHIFTSSQTDHRYTRYTSVNENKGFFSKVASSIKSFYLSIFRYMYVTIATTQFWDSCLLQSSSTGSRGKKRFLLLLLLLLPLLLLAGIYHYYDRPLPLPKNFSTASLDLNYINIYVDSVKQVTYNHFGNVKNYSVDWLSYLKELSGSYAHEIQNIWRENIGG